MEQSDNMDDLIAMDEEKRQQLRDWLALQLVIGPLAQAIAEQDRFGVGRQEYQSTMDRARRLLKDQLARYSVLPGLVLPHDYVERRSWRFLELLEEMVESLSHEPMR